MQGLRALAFAVSILVVSAPAAFADGPATVTVRVEGADATLVPRTTVTTNNAPVNKDGNPAHDCTGTSAAGALDLATAGNWTGPWFGGLGYSVESIKGETHTFSSPQYWSFWVNDQFAPSGACGVELHQGDSVLFFPDNVSGSTVFPLKLTAPAQAAPGVPFAVRVATLDGAGGSAPTSGAVVSGGGASSTTGGDGVAVMTLGQSGPAVLQASKPGSARSAGETTCATSGADGACGSLGPAATGAGATGGSTGSAPGAATGAGADSAGYLAPQAALARIADGQRFTARRAPRRLDGRIDPGSVPLLAVKLLLLRNVSGACSYFSGTSENWVKVKRCGQGYYFKVGDASVFSYLLPSKLPSGRYTLTTQASNTAHDTGKTTVRFSVG